MKQTSPSTYCIFCVSGQELKIAKWLKKMGYEPITSQVVCWKKTASGMRESFCQIIPGYVFFDAEELPEWQSIKARTGVLRILQYDDGQRALRESDAEFIAWLKKYNGVITVSRAIQVGTKLEFVDGPLRDMAAKVVKVNKNRRQVQVALGDDASVLHNIWCSMEFVESNTDSGLSRC